MKEKICKQTPFYGYLTTSTGRMYRLLQPHPLKGARDNWQFRHQQTWLVTPDVVVDTMGEQFDFAPIYSFARHLVTSYPTIELFVSEGWIWTGEYYDEEQVEVTDEPSQEDELWRQMTLFPDGDAE